MCGVEPFKNAAAMGGGAARAAAVTRCLALALAAIAATPAVQAHTYHFGSCPQLPPAPGFVTSRFLGRWNVLQKTSAKVRCLTNDYSWAAGGGGGGTRGEWAEEVDEAAARGEVTMLQKMRLPVPGVNHGVRYSGALSPDPDPKRPGAFSVRFPFNMLGSASYVVFDTDYTNYAGAFTCQKIAFWHRLSASIMARGRTLDPSIIQKLHNQLRSYRINVDDLDIIRHTCDDDDEEKGIQVHIKPHVLNTNVTDILRDTNDVVSTAADVAKKAFDVYNTVNGVIDVTRSRRRRETQDESSVLERKQQPLPVVDASALVAVMQLEQDWLP